MKKCSKCEVIKPHSNFHKSKSSKDGFYSYCKECTKIRSKIYYADNADKFIAYTKSWKKSNPEKVNAQNQRWYKKNPDKAAQYQRNNRAKHPEKVSDLNHRRRDMKLNNGSFIIRKSFMRRLYASPCVMCESTKNIQADHIIPLSRGGRHSEGNLMPLCQSCNLSKRALTITEWRKPVLLSMRGKSLTS